jgi:hypothetical protein
MGHNRESGVQLVSPCLPILGRAVPTGPQWVHARGAGSYVEHTPDAERATVAVACGE